MKFRRIARNPSGDGLETVADIFVAEDYDPYSSSAGGSEFEQNLKVAMESSDSFREWVRGLRPADGEGDS